MPDFADPLDQPTQVPTREGGTLLVALDAPPGEAKHLLLGITDPETGDVLRRKLPPDQAEDIANSMLEYVRLVREGE